MPRFYMHVQNDTSFTPDQEGTELANLKAACACARKTLGAIISDDLSRGSDIVHLTIMIDDEDGARAANVKAVTKIVSSTSPFVD